MSETQEQQIRTKRQNINGMEKWKENGTKNLWWWVRNVTPLGM